MIRLSDALREDMLKKGIDIPLSMEILEDINAGLYDDVKPVLARGVPAIDGTTVIDLRNSGRGDAVLFSFDAGKAEANLASLGIALPLSAKIARNGKGNSVANFNADTLREIGLSLLASTAYGVLNGGSATSYADSKKNLALGGGAFDSLAATFRAIAPACVDKPKGITPAYVNPDNSPGASFLELKMRARLLLVAEALASASDKTHPGDQPKPSREILPLFQMTSTANNPILAAFYAQASRSTLLAPLASRLGMDSALWHTGIQPMISAYSPSSEGRPRKFFDKAYGKPDSA
ncbi:MAG TPA: hypothetical protein VN437_07050, partial [Rectinemataceae bacterium]|nr:hypothetical protein [Rectinemataceae bacterium]